MQWQFSILLLIHHNVHISGPCQSASAMVQDRAQTFPYDVSLKLQEFQKCKYDHVFLQLLNCHSWCILWWYEYSELQLLALYDAHCFLDIQGQTWNHQTGKVWSGNSAISRMLPSLAVLSQIFKWFLCVPAVTMTVASYRNTIMQLTCFGILINNKMAYL